MAAGPLTFEPLREQDFPAFRVGVSAGRAGGTAPAVYNAANEVAVQAFLADHISFGAIGETIDNVLQSHDVQPATDITTVLAADRWARERGEALCFSR